MTRRAFLGFLVIGGLFSMLRKKVRAVVPARERKAMFWRKTGAR